VNVEVIGELWVFWQTLDVFVWFGWGAGCDEGEEVLKGGHCWCWDILLRRVVWSSGCELKIMEKAQIGMRGMSHKTTKGVKMSYIILETS